ncbi:universal stress protein [Blastomonas sp.]|uniref:universal stress protein n=1 Tax=Blastomonas sp. TaxID=1909299 RepID=UPI00260860E4|nr:universal stress protein [Blastomonas sp.]MDM7956551.1 universal stress protein [Blastomonas sp.]
MKRLLACLDVSHYSQTVCEHAAWAATRLDAEVELLHVIQRNAADDVRQELGSTMDLASKPGLLDEILSLKIAEGQLAERQGQLLVQAAVEQLRALGVTRIETTQREGGIVETITEREALSDMVIIGKRGAQANFAKGHLGSKVERVVRQSQKPVLVATRLFKAPQRIAVAFDGGPSSRKALEYVSASPLFAGLEIDIILVGAYTDKNAGHIDWAQSQFSGRAGVKAIQREGNPDSVLQQVAKERSIDLFVMGAYGHSPLRNMLVGSTTTQMIRSGQMSVLLFR